MGFSELPQTNKIVIGSNCATAALGALILVIGLGVNNYGGLSYSVGFGSFTATAELTVGAFKTKACVSGQCQSINNADVINNFAAGSPQR